MLNAAVHPTAGVVELFDTVTTLKGRILVVPGTPQVWEYPETPQELPEGLLSAAYDLDDPPTVKDLGGDFQALEKLCPRRSNNKRLTIAVAGMGRTHTALVPAAAQASSHQRAPPMSMQDQMQQMQQLQVNMLRFAMANMHKAPCTPPVLEFLHPGGRDVGADAHPEAEGQIGPAGSPASSLRSSPPLSGRLSGRSSSSNLPALTDGHAPADSAGAMAADSAGVIIAAVAAAWGAAQAPTDAAGTPTAGGSTWAPTNATVAPKDVTDAAAADIVRQMEMVAAAPVKMKPASAETKSGVTDMACRVGML